MTIIYISLRCRNSNTGIVHTAAEAPAPGRIMMDRDHVDAALYISGRYPMDVRDDDSYYVAISTKVDDSAVFFFMPQHNGLLVQVLQNNADNHVAEGMYAPTPCTCYHSVCMHAHASMAC